MQACPNRACQQAAATTATMRHTLHTLKTWLSFSLSASSPGPTTEEASEGRGRHRRKQRNRPRLEAVYIVGSDNTAATSEGAHPGVRLDVCAGAPGYVADEHEELREHSGATSSTESGRSSAVWTMEGVSEVADQKEAEGSSVGADCTGMLRCRRDIGGACCGVCACACKSCIKQKPVLSKNLY